MAQWTWDAVEETLFHVGGATGTDSRCRRCNVLVRHDTLTCHTNPVHGAFSLTTLNSRHNGTVRLPLLSLWRSVHTYYTVVSMPRGLDVQHACDNTHPHSHTPIHPYTHTFKLRTLGVQFQFSPLTNQRRLTVNAHTVTRCNPRHFNSSTA